MLGFEDEDDDFLMDMADDESDSDTYIMEFVQHKKDYYMNKLEYENVDALVSTYGIIMKEKFVRLILPFSRIYIYLQGGFTFTS